MIQLGNHRIEIDFDNLTVKKSPVIPPSSIRLNHFLMVQVFTEIIHNNRRFEEDKGPTVLATRLLLAGVECINGFKGVLGCTRSLELSSSNRTNIVKLGIVSFIYENFLLVRQLLG